MKPTLPAIPRAEPDPAPVFLTAEWRWLILANYEASPDLLAPLVPAGTELDFFQDRTFISLVGFMFQNTRVRGMAIPFHRHFPEVNLRFYVRREGPEGWRRGVVFIKELVPRRAIAWLARTVYNENYEALPMSHERHTTANNTQSINYGWKFRGRSQSLSTEVHGEPQPMPPGSASEFIAEHYWGYGRQRDGSTLEYQVEHPPWRIWNAPSAQLNCDIAGLYGREFFPMLNRAPASVFVADGSAVTVRQGVRLPHHKT